MARKIWVAVKPRAKIETVIRASESKYRASVNAPASEGEANRRLIELLAEFFHTAKSNIRIVRGHKALRKLLEVDSL